MVPSDQESRPGSLVFRMIVAAISSIDCVVVLVVGNAFPLKHSLGMGHFPSARRDVGVGAVGPSLLADLVKAHRIDGERKELLSVGLSAAGNVGSSSSSPVSG